MKKMLWIVLFAAVGLSGWLRYEQTKDFKFPFTFDQARDMLDIRVMGEGIKPLWVGPTTSINGLRLGPGYYYFNLLPYWLSNGNPQALVYWNIACFLAAGIIVFWGLYKKNVFLGLLVSVVYLFAPRLFDTTRFFWNAYTMVPVSCVYFLVLIKILEKKSIKNVLWLGIVAGISMQFEAAMAIVFLLYGVIVVASFKNKKYFLMYLMGLVPFLLPQILYELIKGFPMTRILMSELFVKSSILEPQLGIWGRMGSHFFSLINKFEGQFPLPANWGLGVAVLATILIVWSKKARKLGLVWWSFFVFAWIFYVIVYKHELKNWYTDSMRVWYIFLVCLGLSSLYDSLKSSVLKILIIVGTIVGIGYSVTVTVLDQYRFVDPKYAQGDPKFLQNQIQVVDWVYTHVQDGGFKAYNYVPEIYDFTYQYIYWWYGRSKYGYMPATVTYQDKVPQYIPFQDRFYQKARGFSGNQIVAIYEKQSDYKTFTDRYNGYCTTEMNNFPWGVGSFVKEKCK